MVEVGDKVFIASLYGQKDNLAVVTGPAGQIGGTGAAGGGIVEGDYNMWTYKWLWAPVSALDPTYTAFYIEEVNNLLYLWWWEDYPEKMRFGIYNIADHSAVFESSSASHYTCSYPYVGGAGDRTFHLGNCSLDDGISRSHQTYILLCREDCYTLEVWRAGSKLWSRLISDDTPEANEEPYSTSISLTGKYILLYLNTSDKLILYEGFDSGTSTTVTETVITDTSKAWAVDDLIGHIVYITSGGANGQQGTITSNTATAITCSAATFVMWGMSVGDTYKIS